MRVFHRKQQRRQGATCRRKFIMERQGGGRECPRGCAVVPVGIMPRGLFAALPRLGKGETDATSLKSWRKPAFLSGPSAYAAAYGGVGDEMQDAILQCSIAWLGACALPFRPELQLPRLEPKSSLDLSSEEIGPYRHSILPTSLVCCKPGHGLDYFRTMATRQRRNGPAACRAAVANLWKTTARLTTTLYMAPVGE